MTKSVYNTVWYMSKLTTLYAHNCNQYQGIAHWLYLWPTPISYCLA